MTEQLSQFRVIRAQQWADGGPAGQDEEWEFLRRTFYARTEAAGWTFVADPVETVEHDDNTGEVLLRITATGEREESA